MEFKGIFAPITTPFDAAGELALGHLEKNLAAYNKTKLAGYVVCGSTGEAIFLTWEETDRLFASVVEHAAPGKIKIAGTGVESTAETILRTRRAAALGYHAALVRTPHYYKPFMTHDALVTYFRAVADVSPIPILVYSIPQFTGIDVPGELAARLAEHPNIRGVKESWGKLAVVEDIVRKAPMSFQTLVGSAAIVAPSLKLGAKGAILALACIVPNLCAELYDAATAGQLAEADEIQQRLGPVSEKCVSKTSVPGVKYSMDCLGMYGGPPRPPFLPLDEQQKAEIKSALGTLQAAAAR
jgi:4-hydroxy-2-oxoglutarate aldolase